MRKVTSVRVRENYLLELRFDDGVSGDIDLSGLVGEGVFAAWRDRRFFGRVRIGSSGELVWGDVIDLCPDALYLKVTGKTPEELFPGLRAETTSHA
jgi:hypothetical protein